MLCLYVGANSIFYGDRLLTTDNPGPDEDRALLESAGLRAQAPSEGFVTLEGAGDSASTCGVGGCS
jgi:biotin synthase-like enzyme